MKKIISNYSIENDKGFDTPFKATKVPPIIKIPQIDQTSVKISSESHSPHQPIEPVLHLNRNQEGIVLSIEVQCTCGEKILIKLDY